MSLAGLAAVLRDHSDAIGWSRRQVTRGGYATSTEQALVAITDALDAVLTEAGVTR